MGRDFCWEQLERVEERGITHTQAPPLTLACSAVVGLWGWHSWQCPSTLGTISLLLCQSQPTLITFKFTKLYWQDERGHCCLPSCWENKYKADLSQESGFPVDPVQVHFGVMSEKCTRKKRELVFCFLFPLFFPSGLDENALDVNLLISLSASHKSADMLRLHNAGRLVVPSSWKKNSSGADLTPAGPPPSITSFVFVRTVRRRLIKENSTCRYTVAPSVSDGLFCEYALLFSFLVYPPPHLPTCLVCFFFG